jgi:hypothetical protein
MNNERKYGLSAPVVPVADIDGLIKTVDLESDVVILFPVWYSALERDIYQVLLNGQPVGDFKSLPNPVPEEGAELSLVIPVATQLKENGFYTVGYRATTFFGQMSADSAMTTIKVHRTPPGATLLAPMIFPDVTLGETLTGIVPGYAGMQAGDVIQTVCNGTEGPSHTVQVENLTIAPVKMQLDRPFLQGLNSNQVIIGYFITDRAGNISITSKTATLTLQP